MVRIKSGEHEFCALRRALREKPAVTETLEADAGGGPKPLGGMGRNGVALLAPSRPCAAFWARPRHKPAPDQSVARYDPRTLNACGRYAANCVRISDAQFSLR